MGQVSQQFIADRIQLYTQTKLAKYFATMTNKDTAFGPYTIYKPWEEPQTKSREIENKNILKFETGKLNIRFVEEEIFINEIVKFSHEIDIPKSESQNLLNLQAPLMLKAVLYHSRFSDSNEK